LIEQRASGRLLDNEENVMGNHRKTVAVVLATLGCLMAPGLVPGAAADGEELEASSSDICGGPVAKDDGGSWKCVGADHFDGDALNPYLWTALEQPGQGSRVACNLDSPKTVAVRNGRLHLTVQQARGSLKCPRSADGTRAEYASGSVSTIGKVSRQYGRFEARIKAEATDAPGLHEAFWMWPAPGQDDLAWPAAGEIDISETYSQYPQLSVPYLHYARDDNGGPAPGVNTAWDCSAQRGDWHTYALEWTADRLAIFVDGKECLVNTDGAEWFRKRFFINLTQLIGRGGNADDGRAPLPATMEVDYVKVWR
jgi:beta-glucanase (GH16 family)